MDVEGGVTTVLLIVDAKHVGSRIEREIDRYLFMPAGPSHENEITVDPHIEPVVAFAVQYDGARFR